jgi:hypothetical protein
MVMVRRKIALTALVVMASVLLDLLTGAVSGRTGWPWLLDSLRVHPWLFIPPIALLLVALSVISARGPERKQPVSLSEISDQLAKHVHDQWEKEAQTHYNLFDPGMMSLHWGPVERSLMPDWSTLERLAANPGWPTPLRHKWASGTSGLAGSGRTITDIIDRVPTGRLVVLGEPGAGKTVLLVRLVLDLLESRGAGTPVPVLLSLASWPLELSLQEWIEQQLITDYPLLAGRTPDARRISCARALFNDSQILPILDGLDEIPKAGRRQAVEKINAGVKPGQRLVLSARISDYQDLVHRSDAGQGPYVTGAAAIRIFPLESGAVATYLRDYAENSNLVRQWSSVL